MFPPGRARLATSPRPTGSAAPTKTMGIVVVACLAARALATPTARMQIHRQADQLGREVGEPVEVPLRIAVLKGDMLSLHIAEIAQPLDERGRGRGRRG